VVGAAPARAEGGCLCGAVRYRASGPGTHATLCHCTTCRRAAGAPAVAWVTFAADGFAFVAGRPARFRSSPQVERTFCGACGTPLTYRRDDLPDEVDVTTTSLDDPAAFPPADHTWASEKIAWDELGERLPRFARTREGEGG
jgi:hypothetical protein